MRTFLIFSLSLIGLIPTFAQNRPQLVLKNVVQGLSRPVAIASAGDARLFVCEQRGRIIVIDEQGQRLSTPFLDIETQVQDGSNEQGLLGLAFHPDFSNNGYFFVSYTISNGSSRLSRFEVNPNNANLALTNSEKVLLDVPQPYDNHNAGDVAFGPDGFLYYTMGDGGLGNDPDLNGQDLKTLLGSILRLDVDNGDPYGIPANNPFINDTSARDEIWSWGWRNPWRFSFDQQTGDMWVADVGQNAREEVSVELAGTAGGLNYGWRCLEGTRNTNLCNSLPPAEGPVYEYTHSSGEGQSITGGYVYRGDDHPNLQGHYVFGDYVSGRVWTLFSNNNGGYDTTAQGELFGGAQLSAFGQGHDGELYVAARREGAIYQLVDATTANVDLGPDFPLRLGPLPWVDQLDVRMPTQMGVPLTIQLLDLSGRVLEQWQFEPIRDFSLQRGNHPSGVYSLSVQAGDAIWVEKIVLGE